MTTAVASIQRNYRVIVAGPTTLWSILNSLQMGFRTLAIEKRTSVPAGLESPCRCEN
jgi:DNA anti-recombination protein RmuC